MIARSIWDDCQINLGYFSDQFGTTPGSKFEVWRARSAPRPCRFAPVDTGIAGERYFEALNGIQEGDLIIPGPFREVRNLADGDDIRIASGNESSEAGERSGGFQFRFGR